ncbi:MAG: Uma2 family endonuclease [Roseiflexaceae bacterium]|nr:Uma2 family endonuclease [Roseiflexaceae bacterium]
MTTASTKPVVAADDLIGDPFRYGWRFVPRPTPDDPHHMEQVPLTLEDVLHPEVGDFIVHSDRHETDRMYLTAVLRARLEPSGVAIVLSDVRIAWDIPDLRPHGPDVMVIPGICERQNWSTFDVAVEGARPALIIEITSPETRENDLERKVEHYARAGVAQYVIVDDPGRGGERRLHLLDYRLEEGKYRLHSPDATGRVHLVIANLWLGIEGDHIVCYDERGAAFGDYTTVVRQAAEAAAQAQREAQMRQAAEEQARRAAEQAQREAQMRQAAEEQAQRAAEQAQREALMRQAAEEQAQRAAEQAQREALMRRAAEEQAQREAQARAEAEARLRALEEELRRLRNGA